MGKLRPQYHYFKTRESAEAFAKKKNSRSKANHWIVRKNVDGYTAYNQRYDLGG